MAICFRCGREVPGKPHSVVTRYGAVSLCSACASEREHRHAASVAADEAGGPASAGDAAPAAPGIDGELPVARRAPRRAPDRTTPAEAHESVGSSAA